MNLQFIMTSTSKKSLKSGYNGIYKYFDVLTNI